MIDGQADPAFRRTLHSAFDFAVREAVLSALNQLRNGCVSFLQIGGNDGDLADPLIKWHSAHPWRGTIVEPVPPYFEKLKALHARHGGIELLELAVASHPGTLTLWHVDLDSTHKYPPWTAGLASTSLDHIIDHGVARKDCRAVVCNSITPSTLVERLKITALDLLCIDVEGGEFDIISSFPFKDAPVAVTLFEAWHMSGETRNKLRAFCASENLACFFIGEDGFILPSENVETTAFLKEMEIFALSF